MLSGVVQLLGGGFVYRFKQMDVRFKQADVVRRQTQDPGARVPRKGCRILVCSGVRRVHAMKLLVQSAVVTVVVLAVAVSLFGQRIANWGEINGQGNQKAEFSWSRLSFTTAMGAGGYGGFGGGYGRGGFGRGGFGTWQRDYPKADRQFLIALNRLTRISGPSTEERSARIRTIFSIIRLCMR